MADSVLDKITHTTADVSDGYCGGDGAWISPDGWLVYVSIEAEGVDYVAGNECDCSFCKGLRIASGNPFGADDLPPIFG